jgi:hypothetical protein
MLQATAKPSPFSAGAGYTITATGGAPPYQFVPAPSPPNPPGVVVSVIGNSAVVMVPPDTPEETVVQVDVIDSSPPPGESVTVYNQVSGP